MAFTQVVIQGAGPLPISAPVQPVSNYPATILVSGSGWSKTPGAKIGFAVLLDTTLIGYAQAYVNEASTHRTLVAPMFQVQFPDFDTHSITLQPLTGTVTDQNDFFTVTVMY